LGGIKLQVDITTGAAVLTVASKKHGTFRILIDAEDWARVSEHSWRVKKRDHSVYFAAHVRKANGTRAGLLLHRLVMNVTDPSIFVDHIHHNYLDCRKESLRVCSHAENMQNGRKHRNNTSGFIGVYWHKARSKWQARISVNGANQHIGRFTSAEDAARAYDRACLRLRGEYAVLNFPQSGVVDISACADEARLLYDRKGAAQQLSISVRSLDYLIANRKLETRRIGKKVLIPYAELRRFAKGNHYDTVTAA
jgi:excisionase family DNA binding protein